MILLSKKHILISLEKATIWDTSKMSFTLPKYVKAMTSIKYSDLIKRRLKYTLNSKGVNNPFGAIINGQYLHI